MKKYTVILSLIALTCFSLFLTACGKNDKIEFSTLTVKEDNTVYGKVANTQTTFSFINEVKVNGNATYFVSTDIYGMQQIPTKTVPLEIGDNTFYITETIGDNMKLYTVTIRRKPMYTVSFNTNGGSSVDSQTVEEDALAVEPKTTKLGYSYSWNYDFLTPITKNETITANWQVLDEMKNYNFTFTDSICEITGVKDKTITTAIIPNYVTSIGSSAFYDCRSLTSVTIGNSVTSIGYGAFAYCSSLTSVTIGNSVTSIGYGAFSDCTTLTSITIPNSVTSIGSCAFYNCSSLTSITIPDSVTSIGEYAFSECYKLVEVKNLSSLNITKGSSSDGYVGYYALNVKTSGESDIVNQNGYLFYTVDATNYLVGYKGNETNLVLPENYNGQDYEINKYAFYGCSSLTSITIPNSVTSIGEDAFECCYKLVEVINKSSLNITKTSYGLSALNVKTSGESDIVNKNDYLFYTYNNVNYLIGYIGNSTVLTLPNDYNGQNYEIYKYAFFYCSSLTSVTIGNSVTSIGYGAFYGCSSLTSITIPNSVTSIGSYAFSDCSSLTSVIIGNSVTSIGDNSFYDCISLSSVTIPNTVTSIGNYAFEYCYSLTNITFNGTKAEWQGISKGNDWKYRVPTTCKVHCTDGDLSI